MIDNTYTTDREYRSKNINLISELDIISHLLVSQYWTPQCTWQLIVTSFCLRKFFFLNSIGLSVIWDAIAYMLCSYNEWLASWLHEKGINVGELECCTPVSKIQKHFE